MQVEDIAVLCITSYSNCINYEALNEMRGVTTSGKCTPSFEKNGQMDGCVYGLFLKYQPLIKTSQYKSVAVI
jgi:hypothetical protein